MFLPASVRLSVCLDTSSVLKILGNNYLNILKWLDFGQAAIKCLKLDKNLCKIAHILKVSIWLTYVYLQHIIQAEEAAIKCLCKAAESFSKHKKCQYHHNQSRLQLDIWRAAAVGFSQHIHFERLWQTASEKQQKS